MKNNLSIPVILLSAAIIVNTVNIGKTRERLQTQIVELQQQVDSINNKINDKTYVLDQDTKINPNFNYESRE